eukprot:2392541-Rhodomonas_salina.1
MALLLFSSLNRDQHGGSDVAYVLFPLSMAFPVNCVIALLGLGGTMVPFRTGSQIGQESYLVDWRHEKVWIAGCADRGCPIPIRTCAPTARD